MATTSYPKTSPCPCGSGKKYRQCCANKCFKFVYKHGRLHKVTPVGRDVMEAIEQVRRAFKAKFGREHHRGEPLFFDPDADTPKPMDLEKYRRAVIAGMREAGVDPAHIYAFERAQLLALRDQLVERAGRRDVVPRRLRVGVTELTAMTWLPALVHDLRSAYPGLVIEPDVAPSSTLVAGALREAYDLIVVPRVKDMGTLTTVPLSDVENVWVCSASVAPAQRSLSLAELGEFTVLTQGGRSTVGLAMDRWLRANGARLTRTVRTDNLVALVGLTVAGLGVGCVPRECFGDLVEKGLLAVLHTTPPPPRFPYVLAYRRGRGDPFLEVVARTCQRACDFTKRYDARPLASRSKPGSSRRTRRRDGR